MSKKKPSNVTSFILPPKNSLSPTGLSDPLSFYYKPFIGALYIERLNSALSLLPAKKYERCLEIGYGSGILIPTLKQHVHYYYGVDIDSDPKTVKRNLSKLGLQNNTTLLQDDFMSVDLPQFDLVVAISVFEHVADVESLIHKLTGHVKAGGYLLVGMPRVDNIMSKLFTAIGYPGIDAHHVTSIHDFLRKTKNYFELLNEVHMPSFFPKTLSLYHGVLLTPIQHSG